MLTSLLLAVALMQSSPNQPEQDPQIAPFRHNDHRQFQLKDLETTTVVFKDKYKIVCWVMDTNVRRAEGMMFLEDQDFTEDQGMIFVFSQPQPLSFWMHNTLVPLDIAYVDSSGRIIQTYTMKALDETSDYSSKGNAKYAIELKAGLLKKKGIKIGDYVSISSRIKSKD